MQVMEVTLQVGRNGDGRAGGCDGRLLLCADDNPCGGGWACPGGARTNPPPARLLAMHHRPMRACLLPPVTHRTSCEITSARKMSLGVMPGHNCS